jgi:hypothetical protein
MAMIAQWTTPQIWLLLMQEKIQKHSRLLPLNLHHQKHHRMQVMQVMLWT